MLRAERSPVRSSLSRFRTPLLLEVLEERAVPASFRTIDGTGNNLAHPSWGSAGIDLLRIAPAQYGDGKSSPSGADRPSARVISNTVVDQGDEDIISDRMLSAMIYAWGQFLDHDFDLTPNGSPAEAFNVAVPAGDPYFDPNNTGTQVIRLNRSLFDAATGTTNARQQINIVTAWLDGSQVYGSDAATAGKLRTFQRGLLKTSAGGDGVIGTGDDLLPYNNAATFPTGTLPMANDSHLAPDDQLFAAGDVRANENIELTSLHTLFVREHNRIATQLRQANPSWNDETLYQNARARVIGEMQAITFRQWLPSLLGSNAVPTYQGYDANDNPGIANEFSTAIFRLGHTLLGDDVEFLDNNGNEVAEEVPLSEAFFNPALLTAQGISPILKYLASDPASEMDNTIVGSVRNFLFGPPGAGGFDLASLNIQRGRDHGLADYNTMRAAYGLPKVTSFGQITSNADLKAKLQQLYGNVNNIDAWVGALAEDHLPGSSVGPLVKKAMLDQFTRLRDGDRFWYQRSFSGSTLNQIDNTTLADVIRRNSLTTNLQDNVFVFRVSINGTVFNDANRDKQQGRNENGLAGIVVRLLDPDTGEELLTTTTDSRGNYHFDVADGLGLGRFKVQVTLPGGYTQTTQVQTVSLTKGETSRRVDVGLFRSGANFLMSPPPMIRATDPLAADALFTKGS